MEKDIKHGRIIIDTSIFTNPDVYHSFGLNPTEALHTFLEIAGKLEGTSFYMPPSIYLELLNFIEPKDIPPELQIRIIQKPPKRYELSVPAFLLYELIEDVRHRIDKGLRVAEEAVRKKIDKGLKTSEAMERRRKASREKSVFLFPDVRMTEEIPYKTESETLEAAAIADLRKKYRSALREGIIDSKEDVDLILLAKELDGILVTADTGIVKWADKLGIRYLDPRILRSVLDKLTQEMK
ncbi:MAG: RNA ligase partner protein [Candidatus Brocadia sp.]|nr:RNA ligase partner protein [Candidatus Brocadia sp.]MDG6027573.1 RNA ligase partner protein [Candidatus Brocadia sp.]